MTQDKDLSNALTTPSTDNNIATRGSNAIDNFLSHPTVVRGVDLAEKKINNDFELKKEENSIRKYEAETQRIEAYTRKTLIWTTYLRDILIILFVFGLLLYIAMFDKPVLLGLITISPIFIPSLIKFINILINKK